MNRTLQISNLLEVATVVRSALEAFSREAPDGVALQSFPRGCCGIASELLGRALIELGFTGVFYVNGEQIVDGREKSHAWIKVGEVIVDITADQFGRAPVIVTADSSWHSTWAPNDKPRAPICSQNNWPMYPHAAWAAVGHALREVGEVA